MTYRPPQLQQKKADVWALMNRPGELASWARPNNVW
jgi:hypothetical protein